MTWTLDIGPNLYALGKILAYGGLLVYVIVQWWVISSASRLGHRG